MIKGKILRDCEYVDIERTGHAAVKIGFEIEPDGKFSGEAGWSSKFTSGTPSFGVEVYKLPSTMEDKPFSPEKNPAGNTTYKLYWNIGEQQPPNIKLVNISNSRIPPIGLVIKLIRNPK